MTREAEEEADIKLDPDKLELAHIMHRNSREERLDLLFVTKQWEGTPTIAEPDKCDELKLFPLNRLPDNMIPYVRKAVEYYSSGQIYYLHGCCRFG